MSTEPFIQSHIAYDVIGDREPEVVVIEFLSHEIPGPHQARELAEQLDSLVRPDLPRNYVIDFGNVRGMGSTAFAEVADFVRRVGHVRVCNLDHILRLGASLIGLDDWVEYTDGRQRAIRSARRDWTRGEEDTIDYPGSVSVS